MYVYQAKYIIDNKDLHTTVLCKSLTDLDEILEKTKKQYNVTDFERYEIRLEIENDRILGLHYNCLDIY